MLKMDFDMRQVAVLSNRLERFGAPTRAKAVGRGLSKVMKQAQTRAKREITSEYNVKSGEVGKRLGVRLQAKGMQAVLFAKARARNRIPLLEFAAKATKKGGVKFKVRNGGGKGRLRHAFIAKMKSGKTGVFQRVPGTRKIKQVVGVDITHMFIGKRVRPAVLKSINDNVARVLIHEMEFELKRIGFR
ncbi:phage tail protein [Variovorax sp. 3P27G3]|jgi:hypothetical protein|uniref:phage tail protein n=1 Tax=Variovorax sp. 3P27G3 TaxID=2502214 RepID=UPI0010F50CFA|nr:phage tail protein [Variovorax sp. 3P27G3]